MPDREKVIKQIEKCVNYTSCIECLYEESLVCRHFMLADALALLKEQDNEIDTLKTLLLGYEIGAIKGNNDTLT